MMSQIPEGTMARWDRVPSFKKFRSDLLRPMGTCDLSVLLRRFALRIDRVYSFRILSHQQRRGADYPRDQERGKRKPGS
jgi:hypothetical protein